MPKKLMPLKTWTVPYLPQYLMLCQRVLNGIAPLYHLFRLPPDFPPALFSIFVFSSVGQNLTSRLSLPSASLSMMSKMSSWIFSPCIETWRRRVRMKILENLSFQHQELYPETLLPPSSRASAVALNPEKLLCKSSAVCINLPGCPSCQGIPLYLIYG